jgi:hypothetical protein
MLNCNTDLLIPNCSFLSFSILINNNSTLPGVQYTNLGDIYIRIFFSHSITDLLANLINSTSRIVQSGWSKLVLFLGYYLLLQPSKLVFSPGLPSCDVYYQHQVQNNSLTIWVRSGILSLRPTDTFITHSVEAYRTWYSMSPHNILNDLIISSYHTPYFTPTTLTS